MKNITITMRQNTSKGTATCQLNSQRQKYRIYINDNHSFSIGNMHNPKKATQCHKLFHLFDESLLKKKHLSKESVCEVLS